MCGPHNVKKLTHTDYSIEFLPKKQKIVNLFFKFTHNIRYKKIRGMSTVPPILLFGKIIKSQTTTKSSGALPSIQTHVMLYIILSHRYHQRYMYFIFKLCPYLLRFRNGRRKKRFQRLPRAMFALQDGSGIIILTVPFFGLLTDKI